MKDETLKCAYKAWGRRKLTWTFPDENGVEERNEVDLGKREEKPYVKGGKRQV